MKLVCKIAVSNRAVPNQGKRPQLKSTLALCKHPNKPEYCFILFCGSSSTKYSIKGNIKQVLTKFMNEGKCTIQFVSPPHDLIIQADAVQLKGFLLLFRRAVENKIPEHETAACSSLSVTAVRPKDMAPTRMTITKRSDYPAKGFPRTLEALSILDINRASLDRGILRLLKLKVLDLSGNCIEFLPPELSQLPSLRELTVAANKLGDAPPGKWGWMEGKLADSLVSLNLSDNSLRFLPDQIVKLAKLHTLNVSNNALTLLPNGIGHLPGLRVFLAASNRLCLLPGSIRRWRLQTLDLSDNEQLGAGARHEEAVTNVVAMPALKEVAGKAVLGLRIPYPAGSIPSTLARYLDHARYCHCGGACFDAVLYRVQQLSLDSLAETILRTGQEQFVGIESYFCSVRCLHKTRSRGRIVR